VSLALTHIYIYIYIYPAAAVAVAVAVAIATLLTLATLYDRVGDATGNTWSLPPVAVARTHHPALAHVFGPPAPYGWTVWVRYNGYGIGTLGWSADRARYVLALCDARDGIFAVDGYVDTVAAYVWVHGGHVLHVFDRHGAPLDAVGWRVGDTPFYRDAGF